MEKHYSLLILLITLIGIISIGFIFGIDTGALSPGTVIDDDTIGENAWLDTENIKISDDSYSRNHGNAGEISHYLKSTNFGFSIPEGATINGIKVEVEKYATYSNNNVDYEVKIIKSDGVLGSENKADTITKWPAVDPDTYVSYGGDTDLWSESWTAGNINNANFGVVFANEFTQGTLNAYVDHIKITVYYTEKSMEDFSLRDSNFQLSDGRLTLYG